MANNSASEKQVFNSVNEVNELIDIAKTDLRVLRQMKKVADYLILQIEFARSCNVDYFIIDYDEEHQFKTLVEAVISKSPCGYANIFSHNNNFPFAATYMVKWMLPNNISVSHGGFSVNGKTSSGVIITLK